MVRIYAGYLEVITVNRDVILCLLIGGTQSCPRSPPDSTVFFSKLKSDTHAAPILRTTMQI